MTSAPFAAIGAGLTRTFAFGPFTDGDYVADLTFLISSAGDFTLEAAAFPSQDCISGFDGGASITRGAVQWPTGLTGIQGPLPVGHRFRGKDSWLGIRIVAGAGGVSLSVWPKINRSRKD